MKNSGTKLKTIAKVMFVVSIIGAAISALIMLAAPLLSYGTSASRVTEAVIAGVAGAVVTGGLCLLMAWIYFRTMDALADATKNTFVLLERIDKLEAKLNACQAFGAGAHDAAPPGNENLT